MFGVSLSKLKRPTTAEKSSLEAESDVTSGVNSSRTFTVILMIMTFGVNNLSKTKGQTFKFTTSGSNRTKTIHVMIQSGITLSNTLEA